MFQATFKGVSTQVATAYLDVTVRRNENTPRFTLSEYRAELLEYFPLGEIVTTVEATDADANVC